VAIYTKKGDQGTTKTLRQGTERISKDSLIVEALGAIDELNSYLGVIKTTSHSEILIDKLTQIQTRLLTIGSLTAGANLPFSLSFTKTLEKQIDEIEGKLPVLANFVIPGGSLTAAHLQYARSLARRAERRMVALSVSQKVKPEVLQFLNRLSDYLFMLAREANANMGIPDELWIGKKNKA
jgi:cob(I)alamin adenosyltransferase